MPRPRHGWPRAPGLPPARMRGAWAGRAPRRRSTMAWQNILGLESTHCKQKKGHMSLTPQTQTVAHCFQMSGHAKSIFNRLCIYTRLGENRKNRIKPPSNSLVIIPRSPSCSPSAPRPTSFFVRQSTSLAAPYLPPAPPTCSPPLSLAAMPLAGARTQALPPGWVARPRER